MKQRLFAKTALTAALLAVLSGCATPTDDTSTKWNADKTYRITILHTNDNHGRFWQNQNGEYGMAARKTLLDTIRAEVKAEGGTTLLLSGGDINTGVPESDLQDAEPDFKGMNMLGYDAMALGNHEFDNPLEVLRKQQQWAKFPMLSANIYDKNTGKRLFQPYQIFEQQGIKIAVIGLTTEDTAKIGNPEYIGGIEFRDPKAEAKQVIAELETNEKPDVIIAATHMGHYEDGQRGINAPGDVALARYMQPGDLDMIVGGHSQEPVCMEGPNKNNSNFKPGDKCTPDQQNGTWIVQAHEWGKYVGRADFEFQNGELNLISYDLIPVNLKKKIKLDDGSQQRVFIQDEIQQNAEVLSFLTPYQEKGQEQLTVKIAESNGKLEGDRNVVRFKQTNLGRLIAASHMQRAKADFAVMNSGGVRDSIDGGDITYKDVLIVQPFGNIVTYIDMSGKEILDYLNVVATKPIDSGSYAQFYGISMTVANGKVSDVNIDGKPLLMDKTYRFTVPSFNAAGGDGYPKVNKHSGYVNTGFVDAEVLKEFLQNNSPIDVNSYAPKGEIIYK
ncbi:bifunctional UDP-sugar hydrolase/5'-nucleotidase [Photobacterium kishitanii]|uniref:bifunctional UDP-sugar hydrolase/5'-nucleotidase UshA n=1 Tax=Photobacterium kishitanii TaxID=318456 RepID=UPI0007EFD1EE|nr:bifunctional UDP-sugar hydrolase/5'-nucleotidase UshA [Photobacterium kishitanii]OBU25850.1 bifunctional UDP-sugar hydrolase/5'-nucleotidase [Photobacterium kishitanii]PSU87862.1 bifunctional UDP-sugar hydrolase/5'-nucleotidase [Photobacterium kishitanii]PSU95107.1 bifunctional UDP-sugar hydrolase/5'-nucleotidase [Photobacterium kishitanii]PSV23115.1 bifunctional UDP-sugar hydrolase/5'-nucleotidase [Photobacterium kishitanii]PSW69928.1 bifunctional UDP-sugar hydrolase/5'-nucleotidase [Photo